MFINKFKSLFKSRSRIDKSIPRFQLKERNVKNCKLLLNRDELISLIPKNSIIAELGVDKGDFSKKLLDVVNPKLLCLIDMWGSNRYGNDKADLINDKFKSQIKNESIKVFRSDSITAAENFQTSYFDFIYIDTDHSYETTIKELRAWKTKIKDDGIIAGHDYMMGNWLKTLRYGVIEAVHQFCIEDNWQLIYLTADQTENLSFAIKRI